MKLLKRRRVTEFDPTLGDGRIQEAILGFEAGDWAGLERLLDARSDAWFISSVLHGPHVSIPLARFEAWVQERGTASAIAHYGRARLADAATAAAADDDDRERAALVLYAGLRDAEATLREAAELDPALAEPWVGLMATAQALRLDRTELQDRFIQVHAREPFRPDACQQMLRRMCARSGGSHDEMFEFARWVHREAPVDSPSQALLALAHIEYAFANEGLDASAYLRRADVANELKSIARAYLLATPDGAAPVDHLQAVNLTLLAIEPTDGLSGAIVREAIGRIDGRPTSLPWSYFDDGIIEAFDRVHAKRAKAAGKV